MGALELIYDYFEDHVHAAALVNERRPVAFGVLCYLLGGLSFFVAQALAQRLFVLPFSWVSCLLSLGWEVAAGFILAAVLHLILEMAGIRGSAAGLFVLLGLADLTWALTVPLILIARLLMPHSSLAVTGIFFAVGLASLSLKARGLRDNYCIGLGKAWVALSVPYLAVAAAFVLAFSLAVIGLIAGLISSFN